MNQLILLTCGSTYLIFKLEKAPTGKINSIIHTVVNLSLGVAPPDDSVYCASRGVTTFQGKRACPIKTHNIIVSI